MTSLIEDYRLQIVYINYVRPIKKSTINTSVNLFYLHWLFFVKKSCTAKLINMFSVKEWTCIKGMWWIRRWNSKPTTKNFNSSSVQDLQKLTSVIAWYFKSPEVLELYIGVWNRTTIKAVIGWPPWKLTIHTCTEQNWFGNVCYRFQ